MSENEILVAEQVTENVEQTTEETPKLFTQEEVNEIVGKSKARERAKLTKQYEKKYGELEEVLRAGTGKQSVEEMTDTFSQFYESKGIPMPKKPSYSDKDIEILARADAEEIIRGGYEEVVEETDRLADIGVGKMTAREKAIFKVLAEHRQNADRSRELGKLGVTEDVYGSDEFKAFAGKFVSGTPISEIYDLYSKKQPKKDIKPMGSMKQGRESGVKDYYSPAEIERLTLDELKDPKVWEAVRRSMTGK